MGRGTRQVRRQAYSGVRIEGMAGRQRLGLGDIERGQGDAAAVQGLGQGHMVEQAATRDIDQVQARLGGGQHLGIHQAARLRGQRRGQHDMVGLGEQLLQITGAFDAGHLERRVRAAQGQHAQAQGQGLRGQGLADGTEADQAEGAAAQLGQLGPAGPVPLRGIAEPDLRQLLGRGKDRGQGELGNGGGRAAACGGHRQLEQPGRIGVDAAGHQLHPAQAPGPALRRRVGHLLALDLHRRGKQDAGLGRHAMGHARGDRHDAGLGQARGQLGVDDGRQLAGDHEFGHGGRELSSRRQRSRSCGHARPGRRSRSRPRDSPRARPMYSALI
eukprot:Opistho-2@8927